MSLHPVDNQSNAISTTQLHACASCQHAQELPFFFGIAFISLDKCDASDGTVAGVKRHGIWAHPPDAGSAALFLPVTLPQRPAEFRSWVGIRDGSCSTGVVFCVRVNGREVARQRMLPGQWKSLSADLSPWQGQPIVLSLETDSAGSYYFDWAHWGEPRIVAVPD